MFLIGEFSNISRVSKRLLRHYDEINLLKPAHIDPRTNYRYYSAGQLSRLNQILALKELGLSLEQIKRMVAAEISDDEIHGMLLLKKAETEQTVLDDLQRLQRIEARLRQNQTTESLPDIVIKAIPAQSFLAIRTVFYKPEDLVQLADLMLQSVPAMVGSGVLGSFVGIFYAEDFTIKNNDVSLGYLLKKPLTSPIAIIPDCILQVSELPAVPTMATSIQVGSPDPVLSGLSQIARSIEANGYRIAGPYREVSFGISSLSELVNGAIEIQVPVTNSTTLTDLQINKSA